MSKLEKGTRQERAEFLFNVYDDDGGGSIDHDELYGYFIGSLRLKEDPDFKEVRPEPSHAASMSIELQNSLLSDLFRSAPYFVICST